MSKKSNRPAGAVEAINARKYDGRIYAPLTVYSPSTQVEDLP
jgi:hypothetical protein